MQVEVSRCFNLNSKFLADPWWGFKGVKVPETFWPFYILRKNKQLEIEENY